MARLYVNGNTAEASKSNIIQYDDNSLTNYSLNLTATTLIQLAAGDYTKFMHQFINLEVVRVLYNIEETLILNLGFLDIGYTHDIRR